MGDSRIEARMSAGAMRKVGGDRTSSRIWKKDALAPDLRTEANQRLS
jgi:hypothetical protein